MVSSPSPSFASDSYRKELRAGLLAAWAALSDLIQNEMLDQMTTVGGGCSPSQNLYPPRYVTNTLFRGTLIHPGQEDR